MDFVKKNKSWIVISIFIIGVSTIPYMNDFLLCGHDTRFHLGRIEGLAMSLKNGDFLGRINPVNGYGYASGIMYPQLFLYIPAVLRASGLSLMNSYKVFVLLINIITFLIAYISIKKVLRLQDIGICILASAFYTLGLYRLCNLYLRAALGESLAMAFLPLVFWGMYELFFGDEKKWWVAVLGWTCIIQSHFLSVEIAMAFSVIVFLLGIKVIACKKRLLSICKAVLLTFLLNAFFVIPFLHYFLNCDFQVFHMETEIEQTAVYVSQMFSSAVENSGALKKLGTTAGEMPNTVGMLSLGTIFLYIILRMNTKSKFDKLGDIVIALVVVTLFAASDLMPWGILGRFPTINKIVCSIQFLFRLFAFASVFLTVLFAINLYKIKGWVRESIILVGALLLILQNCGYYLDSTVQTENVFSKEGTELVVSIDGIYLYNDYPFLENLYNREKEIEIFSKDSSIAISEYTKRGTSLAFRITGCDSRADIEVPLYYYPTYRAELDGEELKMEQGNNGVIRIKDVSKDGVLRVSFMEHPLWIVADVISVLTVIGCIIVIIKKYHNLIKGVNLKRIGMIKCR